MRARVCVSLCVYVGAGGESSSSGEGREEAAVHSNVMDPRPVQTPSTSHADTTADRAGGTWRGREKRWRSSTGETGKAEGVPDEH